MSDLDNSQATATATVAPVSDAPSAPAEPTTPAQPETPGTDNDTPDSTPTPQESPSQPEPTAPDPQTPMPDMPDHGIDPDEGIDPDKGDAPTDPDHNTADEPTNEKPLSEMSRAERKEYFQDLERTQQKRVENAIDAVYQPEPMDEVKDRYLQEGYTEFESTVLAEREIEKQQHQINTARTQIAELNMSLATDAMEVVTTIPWLNPQNEGKGYDEKSTEAASQLYEMLAVDKDPRTNQIINAKMNPKTFYSLIDQIRKSGAADAGVKAQRSAEAQMAAVAPPVSNTNKRETAFADMSNAQKKQWLIDNQGASL